MTSGLKYKLSKLYLFRVTHFSNTKLVSHETLRIFYNIFTMKEYYIYIPEEFALLGGKKNKQNKTKQKTKTKKHP